MNLGHEIGLHYDLETYPEEAADARNHLEMEIHILSQIIGKPVYTIALHQLFRCETDNFRCLDDYINPHDPRYLYSTLYISDSCRAWRNEDILKCFTPEPPQRVLLTIHPELWLDGCIKDRMKYLHEVIVHNALRQSRYYFEHTVHKIWREHEAPRMHDAREIAILSETGE